MVAVVVEAVEAVEVEAVVVEMPGPAGSSGPLAPWESPLEARTSIRPWREPCRVDC